MNKIFFSLTALVCFTSTNSFAQCGKKLLLTSSKTEYLDTAGNVTRSVDEKSTIEIKDKEIVISPGSNPPMVGSYTLESCAWSKAFKEGKSVYNAIFQHPEQATRTLTITIEGKNDKLIFIAKMKERPDRIIRISPDRFEELK